MQIVKQTNNKIQFLVLGKLILSLNSTASLKITSNEKGILIVDLTGRQIEIFTNEIESTQLLPTTAVPFTGNTQSLFELLDTSFFFNVSVSTTPVVLQPPQITSNQDNYTPTGWSTADIIILDISAAVNITGFGAVTGYKTKTLVNTHIMDAIKIKNNDSNSIASNRVLCPDNKDYDLKKTASINIIYLDVLARWQIIGKH